MEKSKKALEDVIKSDTRILSQTIERSDIMPHCEPVLTKAQKKRNKETE